MISNKPREHPPWQPLEDCRSLEISIELVPLKINSSEVKSGDSQGYTVCLHSIRRADRLVMDLCQHSQTLQTWFSTSDRTSVHSTLHHPECVQMCQSACTCRRASEGQWIRRLHLSIIARGNWMAGCEMSHFPAQLQHGGCKGSVSVAEGNPAWPFLQHQALFKALGEQSLPQC